MRPVLLCVDMGTSRIKAAAFEPGGTMIRESVSAMPAPELSEWNGFLSFDAEAYFETVLTVLASARPVDGDGNEPRGLILTSQRATIVPARTEGEAVCPALSWQDTSSGSHVSEFMAGFGEDRFAAITGLPSSVLWSLGRILRLKCDFGEVYRQAEKFLLLHDYVLGKLGSEALVTDRSNASVTGLFDISAGGWSDEILSASDLEPSRLPHIVDPGSICGTLAGDVAERLGLPSSLPLLAGGGDQQCAALGAGAVQEGDAALCLGTAAVLSCPVDRAVTQHGGGFFCTNHVTGRGWILEGIHNSFTGSLKWAGSLLGLGSREEREQALSVSPPGANGAVFLPFLAGIGSPDYDNHSAGTFTGLRSTHSRMDLMRSVYEGIILEIRRIVEAVPVYRKLDNVFVSGGFASGAAGQLLADILGRTIYIVSNSETALLGVAALGWRSLDTNAALPSLVRSTARSDSTTGVAPVDAEAYSGIFLEYRKLVDSLRYIYGRNSRPEAE